MFILSAILSLHLLTLTEQKPFTKGTFPLNPQEKKPLQKKEEQASDALITFHVKKNLKTSITTSVKKFKAPHYQEALHKLTEQDLLTYPREQLSSGGVVKLHFSECPQIYISGKKVNVFCMKEQSHYLVLLPVSLYKETKVFEFDTYSGKVKKRHRVKLEKAHYQRQDIKVANKEFVIASKKTLKRIWKESALKKNTFKRHSRIKIKSLKMIKPLDVKLRHDFGKRRYFNGVAKNPHAGIDLSGRQGDKIKAPLSGEVIVLGKLFYNGNMIILDHGQGLMTAYSHLSKFSKKSGEWVEQGEVIGEVGATGRATGPHLHWSVYLGGEPINPDLFLEDANP